MIAGDDLGFREKVKYLEMYHRAHEVEECWKKLTIKKLIKHPNVKSALILILRVNFTRIAMAVFVLARKMRLNISV